MINNFKQDVFLKEYWQKKHLFIQQAFVEFECGFDPDDIAGLALEDEVESRIIIEQLDHAYHLRQGPFQEKDFTRPPRTPWTLLVQAVDHYIDDLSEIKSKFDFLPAWLMDDIMVSYAPKGGSVGPHYDAYDVFLLQAQGTRQWRIGQDCDANTPLVKNDSLKILKNFEQREVYTCTPGDMLYIPPGCAHWGVSESDDCMTISIGFRTPSMSDVISETCDEVLSHLDENERFNNLEVGSGCSHRLHESDIKALVEVIKQRMLDEKIVMSSFGKMMTKLKYNEHVSMDSDSEKDLPLRLKKNLNARLAYCINDEKVLTFFANGYDIKCPLELKEFVQGICDSNWIETQELTSSQLHIVRELLAVGVFSEEYAE
jgi:50S ribosomal protein L16 3-hydroxylase